MRLDKHKISNDATRADLTCSFFSGSSSSAHCLRFTDKGWFVKEGEGRGRRRFLFYSYLGILYIN